MGGAVSVTRVEVHGTGPVHGRHPKKKEAFTATPRIVPRRDMQRLHAHSVVCVYKRVVLWGIMDFVGMYVMTKFMSFYGGVRQSRNSVF